MKRVIVTEIKECGPICPYWHVDTMAKATCKKMDERLPLFSSEKPFWCPVDRVEETVEE